MQNLSYAQVRDSCFSQTSTNPDCNWKLWREKAVADFGISARFFDLVRTLSGAQRYLQIKTYYVLSPDSATRLYRDTGYVEGVYTSVAGYLEAQARRDRKMGLFFYSRLREEEKSLLQSVEAWSEEEVPSERLYQVLEQGNVAELDQIIHDYFTLPSGFSIEKDILQVPFWEEPPLYNIPLLDEVENMDAILHSALVGLNVRVVDFFRSLFRREPPHASYSIYQGLIRHGRAEEAYSIALRFPTLGDTGSDLGDTGSGYNYMSEMLINPKLNSLEAETFISALDENPGNVTMLTSLLPYISKDKVRAYYASLDETWKAIYRLPNLILQDYLS
ncbi:Hypothetical protein BQ3484_402 [Cedratvirus A11]|uniref:Uncharacterized protein n=1 Tax=Cedratvirus A11 TaxID=1903266 RepID=A0A1M7XV70_9VIRU|nr:Hypothetical protein BQ3484_402 [Cedratvirus A11]SHO33470.1 Hypothetical protein BQ3484_402 [Cedratvirus A11]